MRRYRDWQLTVNVTVPTSELQAVLPLGYQVANAAAASSTLTVTLVLQERVEFVTSTGGIPVGSYGPVDEVPHRRDGHESCRESGKRHPG